MAALPYIQLYVADYLADTMHLTTEEHGAYLLLIMNYWQRGKALDNSNGRLASVARLSNERWIFVEPVLREFFTVEGETWSHARINRDLERVNGLQEQRARAGNASAMARMRQKPQKIEQAFNGRSTVVDVSLKQTANETPTNIDTDTDTDTDTEQTQKKNKSAGKPRSFQRPAGVDQVVWEDWQTLRSKLKAPITETSIAGIEREAQHAGITLNEALRMCCERSWRGFKAAWVDEKMIDPKGRVSSVTLKSMQNIQGWIDGTE